MNVYISILIMSLSTYLIRMLPFTIFRKKIKSKYLYSFFCYIPYAILSSMVFPSVLYATDSFYSAIIATIGSIILSIVGIPMAIVSITCSVLVFIVERF